MDAERYQWSEDVGSYGPHRWTWTAGDLARVAGVLTATALAALVVALVLTAPSPDRSNLRYVNRHAHLPSFENVKHKPCQLGGGVSSCPIEPVQHLTTGSYCPPYEWVEFFHTGEPEAVCTVHGYNPPEPDLLPNYFAS